MRKNIYVKSSTFQNAVKKAVEVVSDKEKMSNLIDQTQSKLKDTEFLKSAMGQFIEKVMTMIRLVKASISGAYKNLPLRSLVLVIAGLLYFVMPIDFIPDFLPGIGYVDDISVIIAIFKSISGDIRAFEEYEKGKS